MLIKKELPEFDKDMKILLFDTDTKNNLIEKKEMPEFAGKEDLAKVLYYTKQIETERLKKEIFENKISPIKMMVELQHIDIKDLASRVKLPLSKVKKHLTPEGFKKAKVEELQRYTKIFDISVADFFQFLTIEKEITYQIKEYNNRLIQEISLSIKK